MRSFTHLLNHPLQPQRSRPPALLRVGCVAFTLAGLALVAQTACSGDPTPPAKATDAAKSPLSGQDAVILDAVDTPVDGQTTDAAPGDAQTADSQTADSQTADSQTTDSQTADATPACVAGTQRCTPNNKAAETCDATGAGWQKTLCQIDEACVAGACLKLICTPGKKTCGDATTVLTCTSDGQGHDSEVCLAKSSCDPGYGAGGAQAFCKTQICTPKQSFCAENKAMACAADGLSAKQLDNCNKNDSLGKPMGCKLGACVSVKCEPGTFACLGWTQLGKCKIDGSGYVSTACGDGLVCKQGTCVAKTCVAGEGFCEGTIAKLCGKLGAVVTLVGDCSATGSDCVKGKCLKAVCTPGAKTCSADAKALSVCGPGGYAWLSAPCVAGQACAGAACKPVVCAPSATSCVGNKMATCDGSGTTLTVGADCGAKVCVGGVCATKDCLAGTTKCKDAATQLVCNSNGVGGVAKACPAKTVCVAGGVCKKVVCVPAQAWCEGSVGKVCATDGMSIIASQDCAKAGQVCLGGGCVVKGCGDGQCDKAGAETCSTCPKDCGDCPFDGCVARSKPGCGKCGCESCVCQLDPTCCSGSWSGFCANLCKTACGGTCP